MTVGQELQPKLKGFLPRIGTVVYRIGGAADRAAGTIVKAKPLGTNEETREVRLAAEAKQKAAARHNQPA